MVVLECWALLMYHFGIPSVEVMLEFTSVILLYSSSVVRESHLFESAKLFGLQSDNDTRRVQHRNKQWLGIERFNTGNLFVMPNEIPK